MRCGQVWEWLGRNTPQVEAAPEALGDALGPPMCTFVWTSPEWAMALSA